MPLFSVTDWEEIYSALDLKASQIEQGKYDIIPGEINTPDSETVKWAKHLRQIMGKIVTK